MEKQLRIRKESTKRLIKEAEEYDKEIEAMKREQQAAEKEEGEDIPYKIRHIKERIREAEAAKASVEKILKRTEEEGFGLAEQ